MCSCVFAFVLLDRSFLSPSINKTNFYIYINFLIYRAVQYKQLALILDDLKAANNLIVRTSVLYNFASPGVNAKNSVKVLNST